MAKDRSPEAMARAWYDKHCGRTLDASHVAALVRAVRRECVQVARKQGADVPSWWLCANRIADSVLALNRAPKGGDRMKGKKTGGKGGGKKC